MADKNEGDPSRLEIYRPGPKIGPDGFRQEDGASIALGKEEDVLAMLRAMGWSEEAIEAFLSGEAIVCKMQVTPFGMIVDTESEDWLSKMKREGRNKIK